MRNVFELFSPTDGLEVDSQRRAKNKEGCKDHQVFQVFNNIEKERPQRGYDWFISPGSEICTLNFLERCDLCISAIVGLELEIFSLIIQSQTDQF